MCFFKSLSLTNKLAHFSHWCFIPSCLLAMCSLKHHPDLATWLHWSHGEELGERDSCFKISLNWCFETMCLFRSLSLTKQEEHFVHWCFVPPCLYRICPFKLPRVLATWSHFSQERASGSFSLTIPCWVCWCLTKATLQLVAKLHISHMIFSFACFVLTCSLRFLLLWNLALQMLHSIRWPSCLESMWSLRI